VPFASFICRTSATAVFTALLGCAAAAYPATVQAQSKSTPDPNATSAEALHILHEAAKAAGGSGALSKTRSIVLEGSVAAPNGTTSESFTMDVKFPNRYYLEMSGPSAAKGGFIDSFNGKSAWHQNAAGELATLVGPEATQLELAARYYNARLTLFKRYGLFARAAGLSQINGRDAVAIEIHSAISAGAATMKVFFDAQTHLILEESFPAASPEGVDRKIFYDAYNPVNGVQLPHKITLVRGNETYSIQITRAAVNEMVGERIFDFPHKSQVVLPDLKSLFAEVDKREQANDKLRQKYEGRKIETSNDVDKKGNQTKTEVTESEFCYFNGVEIDRTISKDGVLLTPEQRKAENDANAKTLARLRADAAKKAAAPAAKKDATKDDSAGAKAGDKPEDKKEETNTSTESDDEVKDSDFSVDTFLRVAQFVNPRRERYNGQDLLAFDFEPNPEYKAHGLVEHLVQKLGGVIWIDERAKDVVRLDAVFVGDFKIAGGLVADLERDTRIQIVNTYVNNEAWVPELEDVRVAFRLMLVKTFRIVDSTKYSDYKKFDPASIDAWISRP
jgi:hypothetical protein